MHYEYIAQLKSHCHLKPVTFPSEFILEYYSHGKVNFSNSPRWVSPIPGKNSIWRKLPLIEYVRNYFQNTVWLAVLINYSLQLILPLLQFPYI